jgi:pilus assembly protein FimV
MRVIRFSLGQSIRRAFRLGFSIATLIVAQLILFISQAHALGLGNLTVNSYLDEPLDLRVELILDRGTDNLEEVVFDLGSRKEFSIAGISRPDFMDEIQFEILPENGKNWLKISSISQMREPFLHILLRAEWSSGSLLREYTALIDPPAYSSQTPGPVMAPRITEEFSSANNANPLQNSTASETYSENQGVYAETDSVPLVLETAANETAQSYNQTSNTQSLSVDEASGAYGPIEAGETLSEIVAQLQQIYPELGYYRTLYVLHRDNQEAFIDGNMNLLKKGAILRVDSLEDIGNVPQELAVQVFQEQRGEWQSYLADRGKLAPTYVASESPANLATGVISGASPQFSGNDGASVVQGQFRIGSAEGVGQSSRGTVDDTRALQSEILEVESSLMSNQLQSSELRERLELLEIQLDEVNQLIALEDPTLAVLQQGLGNTLSATPSIADSTANGSSADVSSGPALVGQSEVDGESSDNASATPLLIVSEESWFDRIMGYMPEIDFQSTTTLGVIGATIVALFTLLFLRRRRAQEELEYSMLSMALKGTHSQFDELKADLDANSSASNLVTDGSHKSASTSKLDLREPPKFSYASSGSPIRLDDSLSSDGPAFDEQVSNTQTSDISSINVPSEALSNSVPTASDSKFNVNLTDSPDHYPEILTSDATAVGALSELSDLMISENASDAGSIQALDSEDLQTQLDLAKVFVELGDGEGAGQILKDVMEHGNSKQKKDASEILSELNA